MSNSPSEFEQQLKLLRPTDVNQLLPETFYRAGWEARESQSASRRVDLRRRPAATFGTGLLCGLLVSIGMTAWQYSFNDRTDRDQQITAVADTAQSETSTKTDKDLALDEVFESPLTAPHDWDNLIAHLSPWDVFGNLEPAQLTPQSARPLSPAARLQWSRIPTAEPMLSKTREPAGTAVESADTGTQLRSFPATQRILDTYL